MTRVFFAAARIFCALTARWAFFWPGNKLVDLAEWCGQRARDGPN